MERKTEMKLNMFKLAVVKCESNKNPITSKLDRNHKTR